MNGRTYRVVEILTDEFARKNKVTEKVIWQGEDIDALSKKYPPSKVWGADQLRHHEIEDGYVRWHYRFECQNSDQTWSECTDPRHNVDDPEFRALEREIDEENRRMFPGDYEEDYGDCEDPFDDDQWAD